MHRPTKRFRRAIPAALVLASLFHGATLCSQARVSRFGEYSGYSQPVYDGWKRSSFFITARDGTRLAADLIFPTREGKLASEPLPVLLTAERYRRAFVDREEEKGRVLTILDTFPWLTEVVRHGYIVAAVDVRGSGASFGTFEGMFNRRETLDTYDVIEWLGIQPWSTGKVGMFGRSYLAITQYRVAGLAPPHLAAIFPEVAMTDLYALLWTGGIHRADFIEEWAKAVREMDLDDPAVPVDGPEGEALLKAALAEHRANVDMGELTGRLPFRDSVDPKTGIRPYLEWSPIYDRAGIEQSGVAVYHLAGWFDRYVRDQSLLYRNLRNPQRITIGPWTHTQHDRLDLAAEHLRFYDRWLKGIRNGIEDEDPVHYYTFGAPEDQAWRSAKQWPLPEQKLTPYYFGADGLLTPEPPGKTGVDAFTVDYSASVVPAPRWSLRKSWPEDLSANDAKGLSYTTPPLAAAVEVTGHPVVRIWLSADVPDADLFVYLEEVDAKGASHYVTEGALRASNRAVTDPGYDYLGMPWHRGFAADRANLPKNKPVELAFDLFPTSKIFAAGNRIRVTVTGADKANATTPERTPAPRLVLHREEGRASQIVLPVIPRPGQSPAE
ncbi:MAG: CocE/NonD family hydrolase [Acidobacteriota bacterium]